MADRIIMNDEITINDDKTKLDLNLIARYLQQESYWAKERSKQQILQSIDNSVCLGVYDGLRQIGFARIISDFTTVFYLADVFIIDEYQNRGIGHLLMEYILNYRGLSGIRGILATQTAHSFYGEFGFSADNEIVQRRMMTRSPQKAEGSSHGHEKKPASRDREREN